MKKIASFLICTRGAQDFENRKGGLVQAIDSIIDNCSDVSNIEILLKLDPDDSKMIDFCNNTLRKDAETRIYITDRLAGYGSLHIHYSYLGEHATGIFLCPFSDDGIVETRNYDLIIKKYEKYDTHILWPNHKDVGGNLYPIIHKHLFDLQGHVGTNAHWDVYWELVNKHIPIFIPLTDGEDAVIFRHYRRFELSHRLDGHEIEEIPFGVTDRIEIEKIAQKIKQHRENTNDRR
jgi:hypothetical protein